MTHLALLLAPVFVASIWQAALLASATALLLRLVPALSVAARSRVWMASFALAACIPFVEFIPRHHPSSATSMGLHASPFLAVALAILWLVASGVRATHLLLGVRHLRDISRRATPLSLPLTVRTPVYQSNDVSSPLVSGFFRPRILLPAALVARLSPTELHHILLHEAEHLRRRDDWTNLAQKLALVLFPFSPALLWMERQLCIERELACDDSVLRVTGAHRAYAITLTNLAEHSFLSRTLSLALGAVRHRSEAARRVHRMLSTPTAVLPRRRTAALSALSVVVLSMVALASTHVPQFITFGQASPVIAASQPNPPLPGAPGSPSAASWSGPQPTMVHADMPAPRPTLASFHTVSPHSRVQLRVRVRVRSSLRRVSAASRPRIAVATYQSSDDAFPMPVQRVLYTPRAGAPEFPVFTFAALPTRTGWLILQL